MSGEHLKLEEVRNGRSSLKVTRVVVTGVVNSELRVGSVGNEERSARRSSPDGHGPYQPAEALNGPSLMQRVSNFRRDMGLVVDLLFSGKLPLEKKAVVKAKLDVCVNCPGGFWKPLWPSTIPGWGVCRHEKCGCVMGFKARLLKMECPMGYWKKVVSDELRVASDQERSE